MKFTVPNPNTGNVDAVAQWFRHQNRVRQCRIYTKYYMWAISADSLPLPVSESALGFQGSTNYLLKVDRRSRIVTLSLFKKDSVESFKSSFVFIIFKVVSSHWTLLWILIAFEWLIIPRNELENKSQVGLSFTVST